MTKQNANFFWRAAAALTFAVSFAACLRVAPPTVFFGDPGELMADARNLDIMHTPGSALFPTFVHAFHMLPMGDMAFQGAVYSALVASLLAGGMILVCGRLAAMARRSGAGFFFSEPAVMLAAVGATLGFVFSKSAWLQGSVGDIYTTYSLFFAAYLLYMLIWVDRPDLTNRFFIGIPAFILFEVAFYLAMGHFTVMFLFFAMTARRWRAPRLPAAVIAVILGLGATLLLAYYPLRSAANPPIDWANFETVRNWVESAAETLHMAPGREASRAGRNFILMMARISEQFPAGLFALSLIGLIPLWKISFRLFWMALMTDALVFYALLFSFTSSTADFSEVAFPMFVVHAILLFLAVLWIARLDFWPRKFAFKPSGNAVFALALALIWAGACGVFYSNCKIIDRSGQTAARDYALEALASIPADGIVFAYDNVDLFPIWYAQSVLGVRPETPVVWIPYLPVRWHREQIQSRWPDLILPDETKIEEIRSRHFKPPASGESAEALSFSQSTQRSKSGKWIPGLKRYMRAGEEIVELMADEQPHRARYFTLYKYEVQPILISQVRPFAPEGALFRDPASPGPLAPRPVWTPSPDGSSKLRDPFSYQWMVQAGFALQDGGRINEAVERFRMAASAFPEDAEAQGYLARALEMRGDAEAALRSYDEYTRLKPGDANGYLHAGLLCLSGGDAARAQKYFEDGEAAAGEKWALRMNLAALQLKIGNPQEAQKVLDRMLAENPADAQAIRLMGSIHEMRREEKETLESYEKAWLFDPDSPEIAASQVRALISQGRLEEAEATFKQAAFAVSNACCRQSAEACASSFAPLRRLRTMSDARFLYNMSEIYLACGDRRQAEAIAGKLFESAAPDDPYAARARRALESGL